LHQSLPDEILVGHFFLAAFLWCTFRRFFEVIIVEKGRFAVLSYDMILKTLLQLPQTGGDDRLKSNIKKH
jgi:hypothetical protein